jgi:hypothetical protein
MDNVFVGVGYSTVVKSVGSPGMLQPPQCMFIAYDFNPEELKKLLSANREKYIITNDPETVKRIQDGVDFEILDGDISFKKYDSLPTLEVVCASRVLINPLSTDENYTVISCTLVKDGTVYDYTGPLPTKILKPSSKIMEVEADFVNGKSEVIFPPDEGGFWEIPMKGTYGFYKVIDTHRVNVVYKLPSRT